MRGGSRCQKVSFTRVRVEADTGEVCTQNLKPPSDAGSCYKLVPNLFRSSFCLTQAYLGDLRKQAVEAMYAPGTSSIEHVRAIQDS